jgi:hypothetical protein
MGLISVIFPCLKARSTKEGPQPVRISPELAVKESSKDSNAHDINATTVDIPPDLQTSNSTIIVLNDTQNAVQESSDQKGLSGPEGTADQKESSDQRGLSDQKESSDQRGLSDQKESSDQRGLSDQKGTLDRKESLDQAVAPNTQEAFELVQEEREDSADEILDSTTQGDIETAKGVGNAVANEPTSPSETAASALSSSAIAIVEEKECDAENVVDDSTTKSQNAVDEADSAMPNPGDELDLSTAPIPCAESGTQEKPSVQHIETDKQRLRKRRTLSRIFSKRLSIMPEIITKGNSRSPKPRLPPMSPISQASSKSEPSILNAKDIEGLDIKVSGRRWQDGEDNGSLYCY